MADIVGDQVKEGDYIQIRGYLNENRFTPKSMEGQVDKDGKPLTVSQVKITGTSFKRVQFNDELNEFEYVE